MSADVRPVPSKRKVRNIGRLSQVISTKVSEADDILLRQMTDTAYQIGSIKKRSRSELLRLILDMVFGELKNRPDLIHFIKKNR
jgi:diacylglycerol kinase family enzyme